MGTFPFTSGWITEVMWRGGAQHLSSLLLPQGQGFPVLGLLLPRCPAVEAENSLEFLHPTGWTLAAVVRLELRTHGQGIQASMALPSLPTPACPAHGKAVPPPPVGSGWEGCQAHGNTIHTPQPIWLTQPGIVGLIRASSRVLQVRAGMGPRDSAPDPLPHLMMQKPP